MFIGSLSILDSIRALSNAMKLNIKEVRYTDKPGKYGYPKGNGLRSVTNTEARKQKKLYLRRIGRNDSILYRQVITRMIWKLDLGP